LHRRERAKERRAGGAGAASPVEKTLSSQRNLPAFKICACAAGNVSPRFMPVPAHSYPQNLWMVVFGFSVEKKGAGISRVVAVNSLPFISPQKGSAGRAPKRENFLKSAHDV
jgi:hypothetical protein